MFGGIWLNVPLDAASPFLPWIHSSQLCATRCTFTICCSRVKAVYYTSVCTVDVSCCIAFPHVLLTCLFKVRMNDLMYIKVQSAVKTPHALCSRCAGNLHSCCSWSWVIPVCALALNISGQKASHHRLFGLLLLLLLLLVLDWTVEKEEERSAATVHTLTWPVCCHPRAVWLTTSRVPICCILPWVEWHLFCCFLKLVTCSCH